MLLVNLWQRPKSAAQGSAACLPRRSALRRRQAASAALAGDFAGQDQARQIDVGCLWELARLAGESRYVCLCEDSILSLTAFARRRSRRAPQQRDLADCSHIKDTNPIPGIDNRRALLLRQKDLFGVFHGNRLAIHSNLERTERARFQSGFPVGEFHRGKSKPGGGEGKPRAVRRIEKTGRLKNGGCGTRRTSFVSKTTTDRLFSSSGIPLAKAAAILLLSMNVALVVGDCDSPDKK